MTSTQPGVADERARQELRELLLRDEEPVVLPPWFSSRLLHEARRRERHPDPDNGGWVAILQSLLSPRFGIPILAMAALAGAWIGYHGASDHAVHLAEVRYLDEIDPVHRHP